MKEVVITSKVVGREGAGVPAKIGQGSTVDLSAYLLKAIWDKVWEIRTDSTGKEYIFGKLPVVTQYGITMYAGDGGNIDLPSLYAGLPIDNTTIYWDNGVLKAVGSSGGGGVADSVAWANVYGKPSWITDTKPTYTYSEITGTPDLSKYALKTDIPSLSGYATESWVLNKGYATESWVLNKGYALGAELDALAVIVGKKADKSYVDGNFVTLATDQTISGLKNFSKGLELGGISVYKSQDGVVYIEGNLVVQGSITMYGTGSTDMPSIIDALPTASTSSKGIAYFDSNYFSVSSDGKVSFIGETGSGLDIVSLQNYLTQNSYLNVTEGDNRYLKLSGGTLASTLTISTGNDRKLILNNTDSDTNFSRIDFQQNGVSVGQLGIQAVGTTFLSWTGDGGNHRLLHAGNIGSYNAGSATKLQTARTIWGQSFNGTNNIDADFKIKNSSAIQTYLTDGTVVNAMYMDGNNVLRVGSSLYNTAIFGKVGIGTIEPNCKLHVSGSIRASENIYGGTYLFMNTDAEGMYFTNKTIAWHDSSNAWAKTLIAFEDVGAMMGVDIVLPQNPNLAEGGSTYAISFYNSSYYYLHMKGTNLMFGKSTNPYKIWHEGNFTPANYLPLAGGTMSGVISFPKVVSQYKALAFNDGEYIDLYGNMVLAKRSKYWNVMNSERQSLFSVYKEGKAILGSAAKTREPKGILDLLTENSECNLYLGSVADQYASINFLHSDEIKWQISSRVSRTAAGSQSLADSLVVFDYDGTNWINRFTITKSGYIGINNYNPSEMLHLKSSSACRVLIEQSANGDLYYKAKGLTYELAFGIGSGGVNRGIYDLTNGGWMMYRGSDTNVIFPNGNIGLGTTSPTHRLHIYSTVSAPIYLEHNYSRTYAECFNAHNSGLTAGQNYSLCIGHSSAKYNRGVLSFYYAGNGSTSNRFSLALHGVDNILNVLGTGNVGIGTTSPSHKLHVVGNTYLNGDVFADELNTFDVLPRTSSAYSCGNSSLRWYQVYGNIGDFSGAVNIGGTLNVEGSTTMTNAKITGNLRLQDDSNYGRAIYFGDSEFCYLKEASDDVLTIYASNGIKLNTRSTSYNVSINTNLLVSGGITMYSQRSLKNIQDERGLSLGELGAIKPIRYTWKDNRDNRLHIGGIADDIQQVLPEVVYKTNDGVLTMDYGNAAFAIASSLIKPVVDHEKRIAMLEEENKQLRQEVERLKSA